MTIQEKVRRLKDKLVHYRDYAKVDAKRQCFSLLHDALAFSESKIDDMDARSSVGFLELTTLVVTRDTATPEDIRRNLLKLGFWLSPMN